MVTYGSYFGSRTKIWQYFIKILPEKGFFPWGFVTMRGVNKSELRLGLTITEISRISGTINYNKSLR